MRIENIFGVLWISAFASATINWSNISPVQDLPGFWDEREIKSLRNIQAPTREARIIGGQIVRPHSHPYQAGLLSEFGSNTGLCGGSIISRRSILTAAHCLYGSIKTTTILGAHTITTPEPTQTVLTAPSAAYRIHRSYNPANLNNDIAILISPSAIQFNWWIQPIALAAATSSSFVGELATVSGWGNDGSRGISSQLRSVQNRIISNSQCALTFGGFIIDSTICLSTAGIRGPCDSDSGGPLTVQSGRNRLQIGVASFGTSSCMMGAPSGFARVSSFRNWINANVVP